MSSIANDSHSAPADVQLSKAYFQINEDYEKKEECDDQDNEEGQDNGNALPNPETLSEIDLLGPGNEGVKGGATETEKWKLDEQVPISPDQRGIGDNQREVIYDLPPGLSTLNVNGRPKFELVTVRENGRLRMFMVPNLSPQLVRSPGRNGRLKMWLLNDDQCSRQQSLPPVRRSI